MGAFLYYFQTKNSLPFLKKFSDQYTEITSLNTFNYMSISWNRHKKFFIKKKTSSKVFFKITELQMIYFFFFFFSLKYMKFLNFFQFFLNKKKKNTKFILNSFNYINNNYNHFCELNYFLNYEIIKQKINKQIFYSKALFFNNWNSFFIKPKKKFLFFFWFNKNSSFILNNILNVNKNYCNNLNLEEQKIFFFKKMNIFLNNIYYFKKYFRFFYFNETIIKLNNKFVCFSFLKKKTNKKNFLSFFYKNFTKTFFFNSYFFFASNLIFIDMFGNSLNKTFSSVLKEKKNRIFFLNNFILTFNLFLQYFLKT